MSTVLFDSKNDYPHLYQCADSSSLNAQRLFLSLLLSQIALLIIASIVSAYFTGCAAGSIVSACIFLGSLSLLIVIRFNRPESAWYNGRAVAESIKTISWRWMMQADPFLQTESEENDCKKFINDQKLILEQNKSMSKLHLPNESIGDPISSKMKFIRSQTLEYRRDFYLNQRINEQASWYARKCIWNRRMARYLFIATVVLHVVAVILLLVKIEFPTTLLPIGAFSTAAGGILTWLQTRRHNELAASYLLATHEITLIKGEFDFAKSEANFSNFVANAEQAFSREHTQWTARKSV